ncbi:MAG: DUF460 domain-containing protein [DPANN group archaeon]|nr:DUF460 domain-containing protein [DPANN group archaeon]
MVTIKPIIIGIDPGTTVGLAFLDAHGKLLDDFSGDMGEKLDSIVFEYRKKRST